MSVQEAYLAFNLEIVVNMIREANEDGLSLAETSQGKRRKDIRKIQERQCLYSW